MEFEQYRYFVATAEEKSVIKAADKLYVTRQTISTALSRMEDEVGFLLFKRSNQGMELTEEGAAYYKKAKKLLKEFEKLNADIKSYGEKSKGVLRIGVIPYMEYRLVNLFDAWKQTQDKFDVKIFFVTGDIGSKMLESGELDCVLTTMPHTGSGCFVSWEIAVLPMYLYAHKNNVLASKQEIVEGDLYGQTVVGGLGGYSKMEYEGEQWLYYNPQKTKYCFVDDWLFTFSMLCENKGVTYGLDTLPLNHNTELVRIPMERGMGGMPIFLRISKNTLLDRRFDVALRRLQAFLKEELIKMYGSY